MTKSSSTVLHKIIKEQTLIGVKHLVLNLVFVKCVCVYVQLNYRNSDNREFLMCKGIMSLEAAVIYNQFTVNCTTNEAMRGGSILRA